MPSTNYDFNGLGAGVELNVGVPAFAKLSGSGTNTIVSDGAGALSWVGGSATPTTYAVDTGVADHEFSVTYAATGKSGSFLPCCVRVSDFRNCIAARFSSSTTLELLILTNATPGTPWQTTVTRSANDVVRVTAAGNVITVYFNGTQVIQQTISTFNTATKVGMLARSTGVVSVITAANVTYTDPAIITSINGGSPITAGQSGVASTSTGFTGLPTTITTDASGVTCSSIGGSINAATFNVSDRVDGGLYPKSGASVNFTFTNGSETDSIATTVVKKATETVVAISSPLSAANTLAQAILDQTGRTIATGDEFYHTTYSDLAIGADTDFTVTDAGSFDLWLYVNAGADAGKNYYYAVTITESGGVVINGGLTSSGLTKVGLTDAGLTYSGL